MLAELYIAQGHPEKGLEVYRRLAAKEPHNLRLHEKIQRLAEGGGGVSHAAAKGYPEVPEQAKSTENRVPAPLGGAHGPHDGRDARGGGGAVGVGDATIDEEATECVR